MEFKYTNINPFINSKMPTWVIMEIWLLLSECKPTEHYSEEDIKELYSHFDNKINQIINEEKYQKANFGFSKYSIK